MDIIQILGYLNLVLLPALAVIFKGSYSLRKAFTDALADGKIDHDELDRILKESGLFAQQMAKFFNLFQ